MMTNQVDERANRRRLSLRKGRGAGFRAILDAGPAAAREVTDCVLDDPRWDRQVEAREDYYARILLALDANVERIAASLLREDEDADESDCWLPIGVLTEMARRAHPAAQRAIGRAIEHGPHWRSCLDGLEAAGGEALIGSVLNPAIIATLLKRADAAEIADATQTVAAPWGEWAATVPALRFVLSDRPKSGEQAFSGPVHWIAPRVRLPATPPISAAMTTRELLELASAHPRVCRQIQKIVADRTDGETTRLLFDFAESGRPAERRVALAVLGSQGIGEFLGAADAFFRAEAAMTFTERKSHQTRVAYLRYLDELPAEATLLRARRWFAEPWPLSLAGERVLAKHATLDDRIMLETAGGLALKDDMYRLCSVVDALGTVGAIESVPFVATVYAAEAPYSYARRRAVTALAHHQGCPTADSLLLEALWDCEPESREIACGHTPRSNLASTRRIKELASDPFEEEGVRAAAKRRTTTTR